MYLFKDRESISIYALHVVLNSLWSWSAVHQRYMGRPVFGYTCMPCMLFSLLHGPLSAAHNLYRGHLVFGYMPYSLYSSFHGPLSAAHIFIQDIQYMDICLTCNTQCYSQCLPRANFIRDIKYLDTCLTFYIQYYMVTVSREPTLRETFSI